MARPRKKVDVAMLEKLAAIHCTMPEMAAVIGVSEDTLKRRFAGVIKKGQEIGKQSLRRAQFQKALEGNPTMQIWLGKQYLGQKDNADPLGLGNLSDGGVKKFAVAYSLDDQPYVVTERPQPGEMPENKVPETSALLPAQEPQEKKEK